MILGDCIHCECVDFLFLFGNFKLGIRISLYFKVGVEVSEKKMDEPCSHVEIPVWLRGTQRWVNGLTKRTTCDDVIYAVLYSEDRHEEESTDRYTIYERWRDVERPLQGRTKILKIWRAWGAEQCNVQLTMKHNDEPDEFGDFLNARHRHRRVKYNKKRDVRERHSKRRQKPSDSSIDRLKSMENLAKLVINQERQLHHIIHRIENTEKKISYHENIMHNNRVQEIGEDYVQNAYLEEMSNENVHENSMDEFLRNVDPENWEMYLQFCDKVMNIEERLVKENSKIEDLSQEIQENTLIEGCNPSASFSINALGTGSAGTNMEEELFHLQADLNRIVSANMMQKYQAAELSKEIETYDRLLQEKQDTINTLQRELEYMEMCEREPVYSNVNDSIVLTLSNKKYLNTSESKPQPDISALHSDYVNIDAILGWRESYSTSVESLKQAQEDNRLKRISEENNQFESSNASQSKRITSDMDDSFSTDTDITSNDSQFGNSNSTTGSRTPKPHHGAPNSNLNKSLDNDDIISQRIKSEMYSFKKGRGCHVNHSAICTNVNLNRSIYCSTKHDDDSDTGLSSMHSDEASSSSYLETLV
ncbi:hypothetical protein KUTeg_022784 [Tegillarca granosa]|uniref:Ras-associating domain-containing protein n=1 Tax=Tegillarca granosa TaxID=220873 RepID=A0ABQ9E3I8_TEGGR|nr:hypothetical protein KUTeg_022784 [Tegillarca granosa]